MKLVNSLPFRMLFPINKDTPITVY